MRLIFLWLKGGIFFYRPFEGQEIWIPVPAPKSYYRRKAHYICEQFEDPYINDDNRRQATPRNSLSKCSFGLTRSRNSIPGGLRRIFMSLIRIRSTVYENQFVGAFVGAHRRRRRRMSSERQDRIPESVSLLRIGSKGRSRMRERARESASERGGDAVIA